MEGKRMRGISMERVNREKIRNREKGKRENKIKGKEHKKDREFYQIKKVGKIGRNKRVIKGTSGCRKKVGSIKLIKHTIKLEEEINKRGYIYGTIKELSSFLGIPCVTLYRIVNGKNHFFSEKIKNGRNVYYFITLKDLYKKK